jgi:predicted SnoaL-like aldol condensation-catalyzing enzyme
VDIFRMHNGLIAEHWDVADTFTFFSQLGVVQGAEDRQRKE